MGMSSNVTKRRLVFLGGVVLGIGTVAVGGLYARSVLVPNGAHALAGQQKETAIFVVDKSGSMDSMLSQIKVSVDSTDAIAAA